MTITFGTMLCANSEDMHIGTNRVNIRIDLAHLTPGKYNFDMVAYVTNKFGAEEYVDGVFPGFVLRISDRHNEFNQINWLGQYWGHIRLNDVVLTD